MKDNLSYDFADAIAAYEFADRTEKNIKDMNSIKKHILNDIQKRGELR